MGELEKIANAKAHASGREIIERLRGEMEAFHRQQSARQMLRSGATIINSQALCARGLEDQGKAIAAHFEWVIEEGLWTSQSLVDSLVGEARTHLEPVLDASRDLMRMATDRARSPALLVRSIAELETVRDKVWTNTDLALRAVAAQKKRRGIRSVWRSVVGWASKLFGLSRGA